jgi:two-component system OmpR family sensor kinase
MSRSSGDDQLVERAARGVGLQVAGLVATAMLLLIALVTVVVVRGQQSSTDSLLRHTAASADDVGDPPPGAWIVLSRADRVISSPGLPASTVAALGALRSRATRHASLATLSTQDDVDYRVVTLDRRGETVQVLLDLRAQHDVRDRLFTVMGFAAAAALLLAAGLGVLLGRRAVQPLAQALALQRTFVADASHELRTPLTLLSTRAQLLHRELLNGAAGAQLENDARGVVGDVQRLGEVVEDLLIAADPRGDEVHTSVEVARIVAEVADSASAHAAQTQVEVRLSLPDEPALVSGSSPALRRAVLALLDNAIDHTPAEGLVSLGVRVERRSVVVVVSDTGPGLAPAAAGGVLRRFHSGGQRAGRAHYGLGLALTHDVANRHGGQLRLVPATVGATFELVLPRLEST